MSATPAGETLLAEALKIHTALIELAMSQSTPQECDVVGEHMRRITEALKDA